LRRAGSLWFILRIGYLFEIMAIARAPRELPNSDVNAYIETWDLRNLRRIM
jgi:hypothetical protein